MSDTEKATANGGKAGGGWSDNERLVYLLALMEQTGVKLDFKNTPRPNDRSEIACQRMIDRLKNTLKEDLDKLKAGQPIGDKTTTPKATPKKRAAPKAKAKANGEADGEGSPKKRGRKKKSDAIIENENAVKEVNGESGEEDVKMGIKAEDLLEEI